MAHWFILTLSRSRSIIKVTGQSSSHEITSAVVDTVDWFRSESEIGKKQLWHRGV